MYRVTFSGELKKTQNITVLDGNKDNFYIIASTYRKPLNVVWIPSCCCFVLFLFLYLCFYYCLLLFLHFDL